LRHTLTAGKGTYAVFHIAEVPPRVWSTASGKPDREEFEFYKRRLADVAKSNFIVSRVLDDRTVRDLPQVKQHGDDAAKWLADKIVVNNRPDSEYLEIGMIGSDPHQASVIVDALANALQREVVDRERTDKLEQRDKLHKTFRDYQAQVMNKERQLFDLNQQVGTTDDESVKTRRRIEVADLEGLMQSRAEAQKAIAELTMKIGMQNALAPSAREGQVSDAQVNEAVAKDPEIMQAMNDLNALRREERGIKRGEPAGQPSRLQPLAAEADRAAIQAELQIARCKHKLEGLADSSPEYKAIKSEIDLAEVDRKFWSEKSASLAKEDHENAMTRIREEIASAEKSVAELRNASRQRLIESIKRDFDRANPDMKALELRKQPYVKQIDLTTKAILAKSESAQKLEQFNGDANQLRIEIAQLQRLVNEMGNTLTQYNIELGAAPRVTLVERAREGIAGL
jgi:hypothetical protein